MNKARVLAPILTIALLASGTLRAEQRLFSSTELLDITLSGSLVELIEDTKDRDRWPLTLEVDGRQIAVEGRVRGKSRAAVCPFPPLRLYFIDPGQATGTVFEGHKSLKLVTHCHNSAGGDKNVRREYAIYRMFNTLTEASFRARLVRIRYVDSRGKLSKRAGQRFGILLEHNKKLATRLGGEKVDTEFVRGSELKPSHTALVYTFQKLIDNNDWATSHTFDDDECCHNLDPVRVDDRILLIPYDFDLSEFVDASYARPRAGGTLVRTDRRKGRVYCADMGEIAGAIDLIVEQRAAIERELEAIPGADEREVASMKSKLKSFYRQAEKRERLADRIDYNCV